MVASWASVLPPDRRPSCASYWRNLAKRPAIVTRARHHASSPLFDATGLDATVLEDGRDIGLPGLAAGDRAEDHERERIRKTKGKCEGRKSRVERWSKKDEKAADKLKEQLAEAVAMAKRRRRANPKTGNRVSWRKIAKELAATGLLNERGQEYNPNAIRRIIEG